MKNKTFQEKLDEILLYVHNSGRMADRKLAETRPEDILPWLNVDQAKQAITSLIKELVAEAKPNRETIIDKWNKDRVDEVKATNAAMNAWADIYEQNLLKALSNNGEAE